MTMGERFCNVRQVGQDLPFTDTQRLGKLEQIQGGVPERVDDLLAQRFH